MGKLFRMGFRGKVQSFLRSYLDDRYQSVSVGEFCSDYKKVKFGVPQGSILGPILFILFINDLLKIRCDFVSLFADDAVFGIKDKNFVNLITRLQSFINTLSNWLINNKLFPNTQKTSLMQLSFKKFNFPLPDIFFNGHKLSWVDSIKYLGMVLDSKLNFNLHIKDIENRVSKSKGVIYRMSNFYSQDVLMNLQ